MAFALSTLPHGTVAGRSTFLNHASKAGPSTLPCICQHLSLTPRPFSSTTPNRLAAGTRSLSRGHQCRKTGACKPCAASNKVTDAGWEGIAGSVGVGVLWAALAYYGFVLSPNQTPYRDMYFLEKLLGLGVDDGVKVNTVFTRLCWLMGVWPAVYASLLLPTAKSGNKVPAWPFVVGSFAFGIFALGPFFALWTPMKDEHHAQLGPPAKKDLKGWKSWGVQATESPITSWLLLASAVLFVFQAATAGAAQWAGYGKLFDESRFCHVTTIDFLALTASAPLWMWNDAKVRQWQSRGKWLPILASIPVIGPAAYLVLRPKVQ